MGSVFLFRQGRLGCLTLRWIVSSSHERRIFVAEIGARIGERIRELRMQQGQPWSQRTLAAKARISLSYVSVIERGRRIPPIHTLATIAQALDVPVTALLSGLEPRPNSSSEVARPLTTFIQHRGLGPHEVQSLVRVAKLMFDWEER